MNRTDPNLLSGGMQGAGGVGGLLAIKPTSTNTLLVAFDGNGNVTGLIDATTGTTTGNFEYGPFGETIRLNPNANNQSPFRFSTKYTDDESDFVYYGFRYYNPSTGRWLSRDPMEEEGGVSLYAFVANDAIRSFDMFGLCGSCCECAVGIGISDVTFHSGSPINSYNPGHQFFVDIYLEYSPSRRESSAEMKWEEKSNRPPQFLIKRGA